MSDLMSVGKGRKKNNNKGWKAQQTAQKRAEAEVRQAAYDKLSIDQKLAKAGAKEKAKLLARVQK